MIPNFPKAKKTIDNQVNDFCRERTKYYSGSILRNKKLVHEGNVIAAHYRDNVTYESQLKVIQSTFQISTEELLSDKGDVLLKLDEMMKDMATQQVISMYAQISEICDATGQTNQTPGATPESVFQMLEKIEMDCDENGELIIPQIHGGTETIERFKAVMSEIDSTPHLAMRFTAIMEQKKKDYFDRENNRKLVD